jgi:putative transposase
VHRFIRAEKANHAVATLCRVLEVSRAGFYAAERRAPCRRQLEDDQLAVAIGEIHRDSRETYGTPRVHAMLRRRGICVSRKRVARLMRRERISGLVKRRRGKTTIRVPGVATAPDLVRREWNPTAPNRLWVADITFIRTWEGWLYLAAVLDCHSRRCVGWSLREDLRSELVVDAVEMAIARRRPRPGLVHHSDHGSQYVSLAMGEHLREAGIDISMGAKGSALDNAVIESFFSTLKRELVNRYSWPTKADARVAVFEWIEVFYNRQRIHTTLGYATPDEYESLSLSGEEVASLS